MNGYKVEDRDKLDSWLDRLDGIRSLMENAQEEYGQELDAFEEEYGLSMREWYEERHV